MLKCYRLSPWGFVSTSGHLSTTLSKSTAFLLGIEWWGSISVWSMSDVFWTEDLKIIIWGSLGPPIVLWCWWSCLESAYPDSSLDLCKLSCQSTPTTKLILFQPHQFICYLTFLIHINQELVCAFSPIPLCS